MATLEEKCKQIVYDSISQKDVDRAYEKALTCNQVYYFIDYKLDEGENPKDFILKSLEETANYFAALSFPYMKEYRALYGIEMGRLNIKANGGETNEITFGLSPLTKWLNGHTEKIMNAHKNNMNTCLFLLNFKNTY